MFSFVNKNKNENLDINRLDIEESLSSILIGKFERPESKEKCYLNNSDKEFLQNTKKVTVTVSKKDHTSQDC